MKKTLLILSMLCILLLSGCSKQPAAVGGVIQVNGKPVNITEYGGITAANVLDDGRIYKYRICESLEFCDQNTLDILEDDMTVYKDAKYFKMYLGTKIVMHVPAGKGMYYEAYVTSPDPSENIDAEVETLYTTIKALDLKPSANVLYEGKVEINTQGRAFALRPTEFVIPGILKVSVSTKEMSSPVTIQDKNLMTMSTDKYDYYQYDTVLIQVAKGTSLDGLVVLK